jgi:hypothetical protein
MKIQGTKIEYHNLRLISWKNVTIVIDDVKDRKATNSSGMFSVLNFFIAICK